MVNWNKEIQDIDNKIIVNFIEYNNIKLYTIKDINTYFNENDDNINSIYKQNKDKNKNKNKDKNKDKNKNKDKENDKENNKEKDNKKIRDILTNLSKYCYVYLNIPLYFLLSKFIKNNYNYKLTSCLR
jgi:dolichol-phosphate mannosyltransferase